MSKKICFLGVNEIFFGFRFIVKKITIVFLELVWLWPNINFSDDHLPPGIDSKKKIKKKDKINLCIKKIVVYLYRTLKQRKNDKFIK